MALLYHDPLSPSCRIARLALAEKSIDVSLRDLRDVEHREDVLALNPAGEGPILVGEEGASVAGALPIAEYLEEIVPAPALLPGDPLQRAEIRRLVEWFGRKFADEVSTCLLYEKVSRRILGARDGGGPPDMGVVRAALHNVRYHLDYISYLMEIRSWLAGEELSLADLVASAHLSCLDYVGDVPWAQYPAAKEWYVRLKSRPSFRPLLADHIPGMPPPRAYANLDF